MIHIVTPCHRPNNLEMIKPSIPKDCNWIIVFDSSVETVDVEGAVCMESGMTGAFGAHNRNYALDNYPFEDNDWIFWLDSDNVVHPYWYNTVSGLVDTDAAIITWGQLGKNGEKRLDPTDEPAIGNIDSASFMCKWKYVKSLRWSTNYTHDGEYAVAAKELGPILKIDAYISFYNYL